MTLPATWGVQGGILAQAVFTLVLVTCSPRDAAAGDHELVLIPPPSNPVGLVLDRQDLIDVIPVAERRSAPLVDLDFMALMVANLEAIKAACGPGWQSSGFTPNCPPAWGVEDLSLWRMLTLTPDNSELRCTSLSGIQEIADVLSSLGLIDGYEEILAAILDISVTSEVMPTAEFTFALRDDLLLTHPAVAMDAALPLNVQDALTDLVELPQRFGPQAGHPGVLDPTEMTSAVLLGDGFAMDLDATDNRLWNEGLDLCGGKRVLERISDGAMAPVDFDFMTLGASGLASDPSVDLVLRLEEDGGYAAAHLRTNDQNAPAPPPGGLGDAWLLSQWLLEYVVVDAASRRYGLRTDYLLYEDPIFTIDEAAFAIGTNDNDHFPVISNQPGWLRAWTLFGLGDPTMAQYLGEAVTEVEQQKIHIPAADDCGMLGVPEGDANARIPIDNIPIGLTGQALVDAVQPLLEGHQDALIERLESPAGIGMPEVYLAGGPDDLYLFFITPDDVAPAPYPYASPGFFSDPALKNKISTTDPLGSGDSVHEKIGLSPIDSQNVYAQDDSGDVQLLEISPAQSDRVNIALGLLCNRFFEDGFEVPLFPWSAQNPIGSIEQNQ